MRFASCFRLASSSVLLPPELPFDDYWLRTLPAKCSCLSIEAARSIASRPTTTNLRFCPVAGFTATGGGLYSVEWSKIGMPERSWCCQGGYSWFIVAPRYGLTCLRTNFGQYVFCGRLALATHSWSRMLAETWELLGWHCLAHIRYPL